MAGSHTVINDYHEQAQVLPLTENRIAVAIKRGSSPYYHYIKIYDFDPAGITYTLATGDISMGSNMSNFRVARYSSNAIIVFSE